MKQRFSLVWLLVAGTIAAPIFTYLFVFGPNLSADHTRWSEFGSAIGGIYSPLLALLTLAVLARQVALQKQMNLHEYDQAYLQQAREDIEFYSTQLMQVLNCIAIPGKSLRTMLHENFEPANAAELDSQKMTQLAIGIHSAIPAALDIWMALYPILMGLEAGKTTLYDMTLHSATQKLIALLSFETCVALDNFHRARTEGRVTVRYVFSPLLKQD